MKQKRPLWYLREEEKADVEEQLIRHRFSKYDIDRICKKYDLIPEIIHAGMKEYIRKQVESN